MGENSADQPLVTVVIPTRDRPEYLREALASALAQTYTNMELLVRDNASSDETRRVVQSFSDPRLKYHRHEINVGPTLNVIGGCREAQGDLIANLHDDDVWERDFLAKVVPPLLADPDLAISFSDHYIMDARGQINEAMTRKNSRIWKRDSLAPGLHKPMYRLAVVDKSIPLSMAAVMRKNAIDWDDIPDLPSCYDLWLMYMVCREGRGGYYVPERLTRYRVHDGSETALGRMRLDQGYVMSCERMLTDERLRSVWPDLQLELARACTDLGVTLARQGRLAEGRPYLRRSVQMMWTLRGLALYAMSFSPRLLGRRNGHARRNGKRSVLPIANGAKPLPLRET